VFQLRKLPGFVAARKRNWTRLRMGLADLEDRFILPEAAAGTDPSWFGFLLTIRETAGLDRDAVVGRLEQKGIQTRMLFAGNLVKHPCFDAMRASGTGFRVVGDLANTEAIMRRSFWVGVYPGLSEPMLDYMVEQIREAAR